MYEQFIRSDVSERRKLFCNQCSHRSIHNLIGRWVGKWSDHLSAIDGGESFSVFQCGGCDGIAYITASWNSEEYGYDEDGSVHEIQREEQFPAPLEKGFSFSFDFTPPPLDAILRELTSSYLSGNHISSTFLVRAVIEYVAKDAGCSGRTLTQKINELEKLNHIDNVQKDLFHKIRQKSNAGVHEGIAMRGAQLQSALEILQVLLDRIYNNPGKTELAIRKAKKELA